MADAKNSGHAHYRMPPECEQWVGALREPAGRLAHPQNEAPLYYTSAAAQPHAKTMTIQNEATGPSNPPGPGTVSPHYDTRLPDLPWSRRIQIPIIAAAVYSVIRLLGPTLRYEVLGWQNAED